MTAEDSTRTAQNHGDGLYPWFQILNVTGMFLSLVVGAAILMELAGIPPLSNGWLAGISFTCAVLLLVLAVYVKHVREAGDSAE